MHFAAAGARIRKWLKSIDWKLLLFLLLFLNIKIIIKIAAIILIYQLRHDVKFGFRLKGSRLPLFYSLIKERAYDALCGKKFLVNNYQPQKACFYLVKAIGLRPLRFDNHLLLTIIYLPQSIVNWLYKVNLNCA